MTTTAPPSADRAAYATQAQQAAALHWKLGEALREHQQRQDAHHGPAWGMVGDLGHVNAQLCELLQFLTGKAQP